jgi:putative aminopeptidase FrvX
MEKRRFKIFVSLFLFLMCVSVYPAELPFDKLLKEILPVPSPTGYEHHLADKIQRLLPKTLSIERDNLGSLYLSLGKGTEKLALLACMDEYGYIVSGVTEDGYLRMDRVVTAPHPVYDSFHQGHPMLIRTEEGLAVGVMAIPSVHILSRERREQLQSFSLDQAFLDIGVHSEQEVRDKGIRMLDPIIPFPDVIPLAGEKMAGSALGNKTCCALLLYLAGKVKSEKISYETTFVWMAQTKFNRRSARLTVAMGASRVKSKLNPERAIIVDIFPVDWSKEADVSIGKGPVLVFNSSKASGLGERIEGVAKDKGIPLQKYSGFQSSLMNPFLSESSDVLILALPVKFSATPVEMVDFKDVRALEGLLRGLLE